MPMAVLCLASMLLKAVYLIQIAYICPSLKLSAFLSLIRGLQAAAIPNNAVHLRVEWALNR